MKKTELYEKDAANLAANAAASCSAQCQDDCGANNVVDGDIMSTRWMTPEEAAPQWLQLDLGELRRFNHIRMYWGVTYAAAYEIEGSQDGEHWTLIHKDRYSQGGKQNLLLEQEQCVRYVRLWVRESSNPSDAKTVLYAIELYDSNQEQLAAKAADNLCVPALTGRSFSVPFNRDGVSYRWSAQSSLLAIDADRGVVTVTRGAQRQQANLAVDVTAGACTVRRDFTVEVRGKADPVTDYQIYPTPQQMELGETAAELNGPVVIVAESAVDETVKQRAQEVLERAGLSYQYSDSPSEAHTNLLLGVAGSGQEADRKGAALGGSEAFTGGEDRYDRHFLCVDVSRKQGDIVILGETPGAVYFGLATLEQMLEQSGPDRLTQVKVIDYANTKYRGFIEGFYGYPWDMDDRISLMEYGKRYKMNLFIYGPKSDPYHLGSWRDDYPQQISDKQREQGQITQEDIRRLAEEARKSHVTFAWSVHPAMQNGVDLSSRETVDQGVDAVVRKFSHLYSLGVRGFALFVDDIDLQEAYEGSEMQAYMVDRIQTRLNEAYNAPGSDPQDRVTPLFYVPSYYALDFGQKDLREHNLTRLQEVNRDVVATVTGGGCWSIVENQAFDTYHAMLGRKPLMWWNYPVNDNIDDTMQMGLMDSVYSVSNDVDALLGIMSNPMNQAEASKISLFGIADYSWNTACFDAKGNWEHTFATMTRDEELQNALRVFAENSSIGHEPVRLMKAYDAFMEGYRTGAPAPECAKFLKEEMGRITAACTRLQEMESGDDARLAALWGEIRPWACKLRAMAEIALLGIQAAGGMDEVEKTWCSLLAREKYRGLSHSREYETHSIKGHGTQLEEKDFPIRVSERRLGAFLAFLMSNVLGNSPVK